MQNDYSEILRRPRVEKELGDFEEWFKRYGEYILTYEESKIVVRVSWIARIMLDEGYSLFPGKEESVKKYVADFLSQRLSQLGLDPKLVKKGDLHGTRQDVVDVVTTVFPNVQPVERPSLPTILRQEESSRLNVPVALPPIRLESSRLQPLIALAMTLLISSIMIILLSR